MSATDEFEEEIEYEIWIGGEYVAITSSLTEARRMAAVYLADGPVRIYRVIKQRELIK